MQAKLAWRTIISLIPLCSCSFALNWDPNGLPCDVPRGQVCNDGYSCAQREANQFVCIRDHSLNTNESCSLDRQCPVGNICPTDTRICLAACSLQQAYVAPACPAGAFCRASYSLAMFSDGRPHTSVVVAACTPSDGCETGSACDRSNLQGGICVPISNTANACLSGCEITWSVSAYSDNCGPDANGYPRFCQPIGLTNQQYLTCQDSGAHPLAVDAPCTNPIETPCPPQTACIAGACRAHCQLENAPTPGASCQTGQTCCALHLNTSQVIGYCATSCN